MKKIGFATAALVVLASSTAWAADMPVRGRAVAPLPTPEPAYRWSGCYVGGEGAYVTQHSRTTVVDGNTVFSAGTELAPINRSGFMGGGVGGCNLQWGQWVIGGEASWDGGDASDDSADIGNVLPTGPNRITQTRSKAESFSTATGRIGWAYQPAILFYLKGGVARTHIVSSSTTSNLGLTSLFSGSSASYSPHGVLVGGGVEFKVAQNWTAKFEYNYVDFGTTNFSSVTTFNNANPGLVGTSAARSSSSTAHVGKFGLNWNFWSWAGYGG